MVKFWPPLAVSIQIKIDSSRQLGGLESYVWSDRETKDEALLNPNVAFLKILSFCRPPIFVSDVDGVRWPSTISNQQHAAIP